MSSLRVDYIVVGQGLAGSALGYTFSKAGKKIAVIDEGVEQTSSKVAAGLYNPVTGRKLVRTWKAEVLFPFLKSFYAELENVTYSKFIHDIGIYRPFFSIEQQNEWVAKSESIEYSFFIKKNYFESKYNGVNNEFGGVQLAHSGYLDVLGYLATMREFFEQKEVLVSEKFDFDALQLNESKVKYRHIEADMIIFCEGPRATSNPYFKWLPFSLVKGEILKFKSELNIDNIVNRGVFVVPKPDDSFIAGSNYDNHDHSWTVTPKARESIEDKLGLLINSEYSVVSQKAGIRPATKDRKPFIGLHPKHETIGIFNGLGTKGVSLAPYFARQLYNHLDKGEQLDPEVNISRYFSLY